MTGYFLYSTFKAIMTSATLFIITVLLDQNNENGRYDVIKMLTGVAAKFFVTFYFAFAYSYMVEINPTSIRQTSSALQV